MNKRISYPLVDLKVSYSCKVISYQTTRSWLIFPLIAAILPSKLPACAIMIAINQLLNFGGIFHNHLIIIDYT